MVERHPGRDHLAVVRREVPGQQVHVGERQHLMAFSPRLATWAELPLEAFGDLPGVMQERRSLHLPPEPGACGEDAG